MSIFAKKNSNPIYTLREKRPNAEFFWSVFSRIRTEYRDLICKSPYSVRMRENKNQKKLQWQTLKVIESEQFNMAIITVRENESLSR